MHIVCSCGRLLVQGEMFICLFECALQLCLCYLYIN